ncbi:hypothetical protein BUALT_Bualt06G0147500 [Buddleja alternifolia]|uniref:Uncharacterized protein n=1 Tax=Buddleja alternifolia TaxID=168488 RepID=A0AAV6XH34_9LAMI|nr:hypothetical protein BUALT_Bualt06G0147500 [Buddleja alternifolia]
MAAVLVPFSISGPNRIGGRNHVILNNTCPSSCAFLPNNKKLTIERQTKTMNSTSLTDHHRNLSVHAQYKNKTNDHRSSSADFAAGFLLGGALFGTLAYIFAPQIRRSLLNEDEYGFRRAKRPIYYDEGLEKTRQSLNRKISQLNSAIDNVSSQLRGGNDLAQVPVELETDAEEATL